MDGDFRFCVAIAVTVGAGELGIELLLDARVPVVLDRIVRPSGQMGSNLGPPVSQNGL